MSNLNEFTAQLLSVLGDPHDELNWTDGILEQAMRSALVDFPINSTMRETLFTVTVAGYEQDISSIGANQVYSVSYPSDDGYIHDENLKMFNVVAEDTIRFETWDVSVGDVLRIRYVPKLTIEDLDGATSTTLYSKEEYPFLLLAAGKACDLRARRIIMRGEEKSRAGFFRSLSNEYIAEFYQTVRTPVIMEWGRYYAE